MERELQDTLRIACLAKNLLTSQPRVVGRIKKEKGMNNSLEGPLFVAIIFLIVSGVFFAPEISVFVALTIEAAKKHTGERAADAALATFENFVIGGAVGMGIQFLFHWSNTVAAVCAAAVFAVLMMVRRR